MTEFQSGKHSDQYSGAIRDLLSAEQQVDYHKVLYPMLVAHCCAVTHNWVGRSSNWLSLYWGILTTVAY